MNSWNYVSSKLGNVPSATRSIAREVYDAARANGHEVWFMWGMGTSSEHRTGRALDFMVRNKAGGDFVRNYLWANRKRLRLRHAIWWQRITSTVTRPGVVRKMADRGNTTNNHYDHVHALFFSGAYQAPPSSSSGGAKKVRQVQKSLEVTIDGKWGPNTDKRAIQMRNAAQSKRGYPRNRNKSFDVRTVQGVVDTKVDGAWGPNSQGSLVDWIKEFQKVLGVASDGWWGPKTDGKFIALRRRYLNKY